VARRDEVVRRCQIRIVVGAGGIGKGCSAGRKPAVWGVFNVSAREECVRGARLQKGKRR
jgi:hypothetical protein